MKKPEDYALKGAVIPINNDYFAHYDYKLGQYRIIDIHGNTVMYLKSVGNSLNGCTLFKDEEGAYLVDYNLKPLTKKFEYIASWNKDEGWFFVCSSEENDEFDEYQIMFFDGRYIEEKFASVEDLSEGYFAVQLYDNQKYTFVDVNGNHCFGEWDSVESFKHGLAIVERNNKFSLINNEGKVLIKDYDSIMILSSNLLAVKKDNHFFIVDTNDRLIIDNARQDNFSLFVASYFNEDVVIIETIDKRYCLVNDDGKIVSDFYDEIKCTSDKHYLVKNKSLNKVALIDKNGKVIINWSNSISFVDEEGYRTICDECGNYYLIDKDFKIVLSNYDYLDVANEGLFVMSRFNKQFYFINKSGKKIAGPFMQVGKFSHGYAFVTDENLGNYVIDTNGNFKFTICKNFFLFNDKYARVKLMDDNTVIVTPSGKILIDKENFPMDMKNKFLEENPEYIEDF